jgi:hypothetical protein
MAAALGATMASQALAAPALRPCDIKLNVADQDPAGLNVRASPGGAILTALRAKGRWVQVHVTGQTGAWAAIDEATLIQDETGGPDVRLFHGRGFVAFSKLGIEELDTQSRILAAPDDGAKALLSISEGDEAKLPKAEVLGCFGGFLKVRARAWSAGRAPSAPTN